MKKILFLTGTLIVMFACSTENEADLNQIQNQSQPTEKTASKSYSLSESEIDEMFHGYVNSTEYINLKSANETFNKKLKPLGESPSFENEVDFLSWIELNIDQTDFINIEEVNSDWNDIKELNSQIYAEFPQVFDFIVSAPEEIVYWKLKEWTVTPPSTTSDECPCCDAYNDCSESAIRTYQFFMDAANNSNSEYIQNTTRAFAESTYQSNLAICWADLQACPLD